MARPQAIYASIPADSPLEPLWLNEPGYSIPVIYSQPVSNWPDLNWWGDFSGDNSPVEYSLETPQYLWSDPVVLQPITGETHHFCRKWHVTGACFAGAAVPAGDYLIVISHAADDSYELQLETREKLLSPMGGNSFLPVDTAWRNVKTFVYHLLLTPGDEVGLTSIVTNNPQPNGSPATNPAMFTWIMQIFDFKLL